MTNLSDLKGAKVSRVLDCSTQFDSDDGITIQFDNGLVLCVGFSGDSGNITLNKLQPQENCNKKVNKPGWYFDNIHEDDWPEK